MIEFTLIKLLIFKFLLILSFKKSRSNKLMMMMIIKIRSNKESLKRARIPQFNSRKRKKKKGMKLEKIV